MVDTVTPQRSGGARAVAGGPARPGRPPAARIRALIRRYRLAPYLLLLPSIVAIALVLLWPVVVFFLIVQRRMTAGLVAGAVKG
jgi:hypothetical protein